MKFFPPFARFGLTLFVGAVLLLASPGCGRHGGARPASALPEKDRTILAKYEDIRAALVIDDLRSARRAAADLTKYLKPTEKDPSTPLASAAQKLAAATDLDKARTAFSTLSDGVILLAEGVEGYYVMESPVPTGAAWVQTTSKVDNPYVGKPMRDVGSLRK